MTISSLQSSLNGTRAHLQKQLRQKDADCNRMAVQIRVQISLHCCQVNTYLLVLSFSLYDTIRWSAQQEAQLSQTGRATVSVVETLKCSLEVTQGHWKWHRSKAWIRSISYRIPWQLWPYLYPFRHNTRTWQTPSHRPTARAALWSLARLRSRGKKWRYCQRSLVHAWNHIENVRSACTSVCPLVT